MYRRALFDKNSLRPLLAAIMLCVPLTTGAQIPPGPSLDELVARVALYPDPLLAQVLTASTFSDQIPDAEDLGGPAQLSDRRSTR
jgi:Protein of unknown function (DUF3300)